MKNPTQTPKVSVIIPMYNVDKYIEQAIRSVLNQSYTNIEVLCIDDGGPDDSALIASDFKDERVKVICQNNRGLAGARNTGMNYATGEFIALLDADDLWLPTKLEQHVGHLLNDKQIDISYCPSLFIDDNDEPLGIGQFPKLTNITSKDILCRNPVGNGSAPVIRRRLLDHISKQYDRDEDGRIQFFNEALRQSEDIEFWIRCALDFDAKFEGIEEPLTLYRVNEEGLSANIIKQLESWELAMSYHNNRHPKFFNSWFCLAKAYQFRYLSRRALQSNNPTQARNMLWQAIKTAPRIFIEEPKRTLLTLGCVSVQSISQTGFQFLAKRLLAYKQDQLAYQSFYRK